MTGDVWQVMIEGKTYEADTATLVQWAAEGYVQPGDKVKKGSLNWAEARHVPMLREPLQRFQMQPPQPQAGYASPGYGNPNGHQMSSQGWAGPEKPKTGLAGFMARFETPIFNGYVLWSTAIAIVTAVLMPIVWVVAGPAPAALMCLSVGGLIGFLGGLLFLVAAFNTNILWGLGCLFVPFVSLVFLIMNWDVAKRPFIANIVGIVLIFMGYIPLFSALPRPEESRFIHRDGIVSIPRTTANLERADVLSLPIHLA